MRLFFLLVSVVSLASAQTTPRPQTRGLADIVRNSGESRPPSELINYATATPVVIFGLKTAFAIDDSNIGICRQPITFRNCRSAPNRPEPAQRPI
jgi:hypothetical protein